ncbi:MAG: hypothetical protein GY757_08785 [bacterium]|nr:hypothetical protein [bacterium]
MRYRLYRAAVTLPVGNRVILDLCGGTGAWSAPWKAAGYDVKVITLPGNDIFEFTEYREYIDRIFFVLAAPDCAQFSFARSTAATPRDLPEGLRLVRRCQDIIADVMTNTITGAGICRGWALENPRGYLSHFLGPPVSVFHPWEFGDLYGKETNVWGIFKEPRRPVRFRKKPALDPGTATNSRRLPDIPAGYERPPGVASSKIKRAITPAGFAAAFYRANKIKGE